MPKFRYTHPDTGVSLVAESSKQLSNDDVGRMFEAYKGQSSEKLRKFSGKGKNTKEERAEIKRNASGALGIRSEDFDETKGLDSKRRAQLALQPTSEDKKAWLDKELGEGNYQVFDVGGNAEIFWKSNEDSKWRMADERGFSFGDVADFAGSAIPLAGGTIAGIAAGTAAGGPIGSVLGGAAGFAGASAGLGGLQDVAVRAAEGRDIDAGEILERRGVDAAKDFATDIALGGVLGAGSRVLRTARGGRAVDDLKALEEATGRQIDPSLTVSDRQLQAMQGTERALGGSRPLEEARQVATEAAIGQPAPSDVIRQRLGQLDEVEQTRLRTVNQAEEAVSESIARARAEELGQAGATVGRGVPEISEEIYTRQIDPAFQQVDALNEANYNALRRAAAADGPILSQGEFREIIEDAASRTQGKATVDLIANDPFIQTKLFQPLDANDIDQVLSNLFLRGMPRPDAVAMQKAIMSKLEGMKDVPSVKAMNNARSYYKDVYEPLRTEVSRGSQEMVNGLLRNPSRLRALKETEAWTPETKDMLVSRWFAGKGVTPFAPNIKGKITETDRAFLDTLLGERGRRRIETMVNNKATTDEMINALYAPSDKRFKELSKQAKEAADLRKVNEGRRQSDLISKIQDGKVSLSEISNNGRAFLGAKSSEIRQLMKEASPENRKLIQDGVTSFLVKNDDLAGAVARGDDVAVKRMKDQFTRNSNKMKAVFGEAEYKRRLAGLNAMEALAAEGVKKKNFNPLGSGFGIVSALAGIPTSARNAFFATMWSNRLTSKMLRAVQEGNTALFDRNLNETVRAMRVAADASGDPELEQATREMEGR